ncbi:hypothetical protein ACVWVQ_002330 [Thermostichus sp. MS-CIW-36]
MEQRLTLVCQLEPTAEQAAEFRGTPQAFVIRTTIPNAPLCASNAQISPALTSPAAI